MTYIPLCLVSVALLLATVGFLNERRLRRGLEDVLRRLIKQWSSHANTETRSRPPYGRDRVDHNERVRQER